MHEPDHTQPGNLALCEDNVIVLCLQVWAASVAAEGACRGGSWTTMNGNPSHSSPVPIPLSGSAAFLDARVT